MKRGKTLVLFLGLAVAPLVLGADDKCNCKQFPYEPDPPCFKMCTDQLLKTNSKGELERVLGLSPALARKVSASAVDLTSAEKKELENRLKGLNQAKVDALNKYIE
jgi:hypothetical protein